MGWWSGGARRAVVLLVAAVGLLISGTVALAAAGDDDRPDRPAAIDGQVVAEDEGSAEPARRPSTTAAPTTAATTTTTSPPPPPTEPPAPAVVPAPATIGARFTLDPYHGLGAWIDVFDWSWSFTEGQPHIALADIDRMASLGVRTLYVQAARWDHPADIVDLDLLQPIIDRAHGNGMHVVAWYLPTLVDPVADLRRTVAMAALAVDGIGIDIESRDVVDVAERNARLLAYSAELRRALPGEVLSGIVLPPVVMEDINPNYWPGFPWRELAGFYDVWQPMGYWTNRRADSGWRDGYAYTAVNIDRVREHLGWLDAPVHPIGGIGDETTPEQVAAMVQASAERGVLGGSLYDYRTTRDDLWPVLAAFNG